MTLWDGTKEYRVNGVRWQMNENEVLPQSTLSARANDGEKLAIVMPKDWNMPLHVGENAVLMSRSIKNPRWQTSQPMDYQKAVSMGSQVVHDYENGKELAAMRANQHSPQMAKAIRDYDRENQKPMKMGSEKARKRLLAANGVYRDRIGNPNARAQAKARANANAKDKEPDVGM